MSAPLELASADCQKHPRSFLMTLMAKKDLGWWPADAPPAKIAIVTTLHLEVLHTADLPHKRPTQGRGSYFLNELIVKFGMDENESQFWRVRWCGSSSARAWPIDAHQENLSVMCCLFAVNPKGD